MAEGHQRDRNRLVQFVDGNPLIISGSIKANIMLGTTASPKDLQSCLQVLNLAVEPLFCEYRSRRFLDSSSLSTGQAVMISLVRAALMRPQPLLLDEALTSRPEERHRSSALSQFDQQLTIDATGQVALTTRKTP